MVLDAAGLQISAASYTAAVDAAELDIHDTGLRVDARGLDTVYRSFDVVYKSRRVRVVDTVLNIVDERLGMPDACFENVDERLPVVGVLRGSRRGNLHLRRGLNICVLPFVRQQRVHTPQDMHNLDGSEKFPHKCEWHNGRRKQAIPVDPTGITALRAIVSDACRLPYQGRLA